MQQLWNTTNLSITGESFLIGTKTALVELMDDLWQEQDGAGTSTFIVLDLSVAFNIINHGI